MNKIYFVRHAKPDFSVHDDLTRPLTEEGIESSKRVAQFFNDKNITKMYSSPYLRSIDTIKVLSQNLGLEIELVEDFRERTISDRWIENFNDFAEKQWTDFTYKLEYGESLNEVQARNIKELTKLLEENSNENIVVGTHGTALSTILNYFDPSFNLDSFRKIQSVMPWIACLEFEGNELISVENFLDI